MTTPRQPTEAELRTAAAVEFGGKPAPVIASNLKRGCLWHRKGGSEWIAFPGREWIDRKWSEAIRRSDPVH